MWKTQKRTKETWYNLTSVASLLSIFYSILFLSFPFGNKKIKHGMDKNVQTPKQKKKKPDSNIHVSKTERKRLKDWVWVRLLFIISVLIIISFGIGSDYWFESGMDSFSCLPRERKSEDQGEGELSCHHYILDETSKKYLLNHHWRVRSASHGNEMCRWVIPKAQDFKFTFYLFPDIKEWLIDAFWFLKEMLYIVAQSVYTHSIQ